MMRFCRDFCRLACFTIGMVIILEARPQQVRRTTLINATDIFHEDYEDVDLAEKKVLKRNTTEEGSAVGNNSTVKMLILGKTRILTHPSRRGSFQITDEESNDQDIIFPDSPESLDHIPKLEDIPTCARDSTFCEHVETYPYHYVKQVLQQRKSNLDLFATDEEPENEEIANRIGEPEDFFVCPFYEKTVFPKVGKNTNNQWRYIINQGDKDGYIQGVRVETCKTLNSPCELFSSIPNGYITNCKQKYVYRRMMSISEDGDPIADTFLMPSACCCAYKRDSQFLVNFGSKSTKR